VLPFFYMTTALFATLQQLPKEHTQI